LIQLYQKLERMTREQKCSWELSSEVNSYYLQLQSLVIRIGEKEAFSSDAHTYTFQILKNGEFEVNRKVDHNYSEEYGHLGTLYHSIQSYYANNLQSVVNNVESELDKL
jgi:hypothetical protein